MDAWTYQGIELQPTEKPEELFRRICRLEAALRLSVQFQAIGTFHAPMSKSEPPRYNSKGHPRRFLHITWQRESALAWSVVLHVAEKDRRALLSSFTGTGFLAKDIDLRDGHPREAVLLAAFNSDAEDFLKPLSEVRNGSEEERADEWRACVERGADRLAQEGVDPDQLSSAAWLAESRKVRFEHGWYLSSGVWRSRYLIQSTDGSMALAAAQDSLCTCASRHPETLQLMMPSERCVHHLAARLVDAIAESVLELVQPL